MDPQEEAEFEALFTDEYWEQMRQAMIEYLEAGENLQHMAEEMTGKQFEGRTEVRNSLYDALIRDAGKRPAYLTDVTSDFKEMLRRHYEEILSSAKRCADEVGVCNVCGSTNIVGSVAASFSKFKSSVGCDDCGTLIEWY
jgi:hypothetical protein